MSRDLVIAVAPGETRAVVADDGGAVELHIARLGDGSRVGEIHLGRVLRVLPDLPAALVEIGAERPAFLSAEDAVDAAPPGKRDSGIAAWLTEGQAILVQVTRDAQGDKAIGVTLRLRFAGALLSLTPTRGKLVLPRGCTPEQRALLESLLPAGQGATVHPAALAADRTVLAHEIAALRARFAAVEERSRTAAPPALVESSDSPLGRLLAALIVPPPDRILIDDRAGFAAARRWLQQHRPELVAALAYDDDGSSDDIFERHGIAGDLEAATSRHVALADGGALIVETAAAMSAIDVDGGAAVGGHHGAARAVLAVNLAAARAAARQIRLRNLAGAIVIDFISMRSPADRALVLEALAAALASDPATPQILGWTRLGHVELTRRRGARPLAEILFEPASPAKTALTIALEALRAAARQAALQPGSTPRLIVHPTIAATLAGAAAGALRELADRLASEIVVTADAERPREAFDIRLN